MIRAKISEIFKSIQGEGKYVGCVQTFLRFWDCNLDCCYCDTKPKSYRQYSDRDLKDQIALEKNISPWLVLTGGEPLLQADFLGEFLPQIKKKKIYLETNATLVKEVKKIVKHVDTVSFDIKLKSSTGENSPWSKHQDFFQVVKQKDLFFKMIISRTTTDYDIKKTAEFMQDKKKFTLYLQPEAKSLSRALIKRLVGFQEYFTENNIDSRILPQVHKFLGIK
jgi:7-carboxy-7-deazaguanine synthase